MNNRLFGPEWYAFLPYHYCQPSRRVVGRRTFPMAQSTSTTRWSAATSFAA